MPSALCFKGIILAVELRIDPKVVNGCREISLKTPVDGQAGEARYLN